MNWKMDFDKTSFSVDWFTPGDKIAPKRLSFPKSARISIDDFVSDSPLSFCFTPAGEVVPRSRAYSFVDTLLEERASGWANSLPPSPLVPPPETYPMYDLDAKTYMEASLTDERTSSLFSIANDCSACGVDVDVSCFEALDEQLIVAPMECFTELCWAEAIQDETMAMAMPPPPPPPPSALPQPKPPQPDVQQKHVRPRSRSIKRDQESAFSPLSLALDDFSGSFERTRPLAAKITLPLEPSPHALSSPFSQSYDTLSTFQEKRPLAHIMYAEPDERLLASPDHHEGSPYYYYGSSVELQSPPPPRWRLEKRNLPLTTTKMAVIPPFVESPRASSTSLLRPAKSSQALRAISDACHATFSRARRKSPLYTDPSSHT